MTTLTLNCLGWMQNQNDQSPCAIAQAVGQLCSPGYTVSLANFQESQYTPNATTANGCTCSWSIYNLLSACSYCVGKSQYTSWNTWATSCGSYVSNNSYLPSGLGIPQGIPFWAGINPSTWENATFNVTQAADIASSAQPDVTGGPLPSSTMTSSSSSSGSVGAIVGGLVGGIIIIIVGGLFFFCAVRHRRSQRTRSIHAGMSSSNAPQPVIVPSIRNWTPAQLILFGRGPSSLTFGSPYLTSPIHSTTSLAPRTPFASALSPGFSNEHSVSMPIADAADMISPFLTMSPTRQTNRPNVSLPTGKAAEVLSERVMAPPGQRVRLNPPPYSVSGGEPGMSTVMATTTRGLSTKKEKEKRRRSSMSGETALARRSRTSTKASATTIHTSAQTEQGGPQAETSADTVGTMEHIDSTVDDGEMDHVDGGVEMTPDEEAEGPDHATSVV